jgi:outer membrane lipoprotein-sorting protein
MFGSRILSLERKMMHGFRSHSVTAGTLATLLAISFGARAADNSLDTAFVRLDKAAATFKGLTADMTRTHHTELVNANETDQGKITLKKIKANDVRFLINFTDPEPKLIALGGGKGLMYTPKTKEAQEADLKKHRDLINDVLLLGFGSSSAELKGKYTILPGGPESIDGTATIRIELVPKSEDLRHNIKKAELWIPENGIPVQQKFYESGGDYTLATYSHIALSSNIPDSAVKLELPKGVKVVPYR